MNPIARMMKRYIKMPLRYALPLLFIAALVFASTTGCTYPNFDKDYRQSTTLTAAWLGSKPISAPVTSGGLMVSGRLTSTLGGTPLAKKEVQLWYSDSESGQFDLSNSFPYTGKISTTDNDGNYKITLSSNEDTHRAYGTVFIGEGVASDTSGWMASGWNIAVAYHGLVDVFDSGKTSIQQQSSSFIPGTLTGTVTVLNAAELQIKYGRYSDAADNLQTKLLPRFAKVANLPTTGTSYWIKDPGIQPQAYHWIVEQTNACRIMSGQITESSISSQPTVYSGQVLPTQ